MAGPHLRVGVGPTPEEWYLTAAGVVGTIVTPGVRVLIRPKIPLRNLFLLLDVGLRPEDWHDAHFSFGTSPDLLAAVAAFFVREAGRALARGPRRDYRATEERLVALRGRIDIAAQLRHPGVASPIACRYDEYSVDVAENVALRAATRRLLRVGGVLPDTRRHLERLLAGLIDVSDLEPRPEAVDAIPINRLNRHYVPALRLASLVLRHASLVDQAGDTPASAFLMSTPLLFQRWVTNRLRRALVRQLDVEAEPRVDLDVAGRVRMEPDLVFRRQRRAVYVGDIKYKLSSGLGRTGDYYQLLAYATSLGLARVCSSTARTTSRLPIRR